MAVISFIISSSMARRPAVSMITKLYPSALALEMALRAILTGSIVPSSVYRSTSVCSAKILSCSIAAGRYTSHATNKGLRPRFVRQLRASLPLKVVLPEPCKPATKTIPGEPFIFISVASSPISRASSSCTIFVIICPGRTAFSFTSSQKLLAIL